MVYYKAKEKKKRYKGRKEARKNQKSLFENNGNFLLFAVGTNPQARSRASMSQSPRTSFKLQFLPAVPTCILPSTTTGKRLEVRTMGKGTKENWFKPWVRRVPEGWPGLRKASRG